jgi:hypothetical protein
VAELLLLQDASLGVPFLTAATMNSATTLKVGAQDAQFRAFTSQYQTIAEQLKTTSVSKDVAEQQLGARALS